MHRFAFAVRAATLALIFNSVPAFAQSGTDFQALEKQIQDLQAKVAKLQREQADSTVNYSGSPAGAKDVIEENKIKLAAGVTELKLYGDLRMRYQYDEFHPVFTPSNLVTDDRNRFRFRLRIGADIQLGDQFFAGVTLASSPQADSNNQTFTEGYDNYGIYIDKAFAGWTPTDWFTIILGKQSNPFYTTPLVWDPNITPAGVVEVLDLSKAFLPDNSRLSLQLISMQGAFFNGGSYTVGADSAWQFVEQLKATYSMNKDVSVTLAPGFMTYTAASLSGLQNSLAFDKPADVFAAPLGVQTQTTTTNTETRTVKYSSTGVPTVTITPINTTTTVTTTDPATGATRTVTTTTANKQVQEIVATTLPTNKALANQTFVSTKTAGGGTTTVTSPVGEAPAEETKDLAIITAPGDISFKLGGIATKVYWDFAYNTEGGSRATNEYFLTTHKSIDDFAWLAGFQLGDNIRAGDWSMVADFRRIGMDSIDPNLDEVTWDLSYINMEGFHVRVAYSLTDSLVGSLNFSHSWQLRGITGGEATGGAALANAKAVDVLQLDMNLKF
jgi:hypothetical protein